MKLFLMLIALNSFFCACAKPNYQDTNIGEKDTKPIVNPCPLFFKQERVCAKLEWEKRPTETEAGSFNLKLSIPENPSELTDPKHTPAVVLWMPSMGHGSSPVTVKKTAKGIYEATNVFFIMPGQWNIRLQLKNNDEVIDEVIQTISI